MLSDLMRIVLDCSEIIRSILHLTKLRSVLGSAIPNPRVENPPGAIRTDCKSHNFDV